MNSNRFPVPAPEWKTERDEWLYDPLLHVWFRWVQAANGDWCRLNKLGHETWELWVPDSKLGPGVYAVLGQKEGVPQSSTSTAEGRGWWKAVLGEHGDCGNLSLDGCRRCSHWPQCVEWPCTTCRVCDKWPQCLTRTLSDDPIEGAPLGQAEKKQSNNPLPAVLPKLPAPVVGLRRPLPSAPASATTRTGAAAVAPTVAAAATPGSQVLKTNAGGGEGPVVRLHVPKWSDVPPAVQQTLASLAGERRRRRKQVPRV